MIHQGLVDIHLASQYLAAAGISFLPKKDDDSHTNLGYSADGSYFYSRPLNENGDFLTLDLVDFAIEWRSDSNTKSLTLHNQLHQNILNWISENAASAQIPQPYQYKFHYSLPYSISDHYQYHKDEAALQKEIQLRSLAQLALEDILNEFDMDSEIRTWPHHFDSGAFASLPQSEEISVGLGLAIPDSLIDQYYFYIAAYKGHQIVPTSSFDPLSVGNWINEDFKGAILAANEDSIDVVQSFFREALQVFS